MLFSCKSDWGNYGEYRLDYDSELEYYIVMNQTDEICTNPLGYSHKGAIVIFYGPEESVDTFCIDKGGIVIESFVADVAFDSLFILVDQKPLEKICECNIECLEEVYNREPHTSTSFDFCKKGLEKSKIHDYWIIVKQPNKIYGPLSKHAYVKKKEELMVPKHLSLKSEKIF